MEAWSHTSSILKKEQWKTNRDIIIIIIISFLKKNLKPPILFWAAFLFLSIYSFINIFHN